MNRCLISLNVLKNLQTILSCLHTVLRIIKIISLNLAFLEGLEKELVTLNKKHELADNHQNWLFWLVNYQTIQKKEKYKADNFMNLKLQQLSNQVRSTQRFLRQGQRSVFLL